MRVAIVGVGLIGGSLAISLKESGLADYVLGVDASQDNLDKAVRRRLVDEDVVWSPAVLREGAKLKSVDVIVLATPVDVMLKLLPELLDGVGERQVILDVGSTKQQLLDAVQDHPKRARYVACHPMAGTEYSGPEAAIPNLYTGKTCVIVDRPDSAPDAVARAEAVFTAAGMHFSYLDRSAHDLHCAYVSHISHIASFALALTVLEKEKDERRIFELASSGFSSTVRLASSSADMWTPIFRQNRDHVLDVLDEHIEQLSRFRTQLIKRDFKGFYERIERANEISKIIK